MKDFRKGEDDGLQSVYNADRGTLGGMDGGNLAESK